MNVVARDALEVLEAVDDGRHLHASVRIVCFFVSAGFGVTAFFVAVDLALTEGLTEQGAWMVTSVAFALIFPVWILAFLLCMTLLNALGVRDLRAAARKRLSRLALKSNELDDLCAVLDTHRWKHRDLLRSAVSDLADVDRAR